MTLLFILSTRELGSSLFLYSTGSMVMSVQLLQYYDGGAMNVTAAYSLVQMAPARRRHRPQPPRHPPGAAPAGDRQRRTSRTLMNNPRHRYRCRGRRHDFSQPPHTLPRRHALAGAAIRPACAAGLRTLRHARSTLPSKEGRVVLYTASFTEVEQATAAAFNKRFPFVKVEVIRASGGQLITRVRNEAAAGKLVADIVDHSDRGLMKPIADLFIDYAPPNAADYLHQRPASPRTLLAPHHPRLVHRLPTPSCTKTPPKTWMDLTNAATYKPTGTIGQVIAPSGGTTWTRIMFERQVLGDDYWTKQAATKPTLYPSSGPDHRRHHPRRGPDRPHHPQRHLPQAEGRRPGRPRLPTRRHPRRPLRLRHPQGLPTPERRPPLPRLVPLRRRPDLHHEGTGQPHLAQDPPVALAGYDPARPTRSGSPTRRSFETLHDPWTEEWNKIYGYRQ